MRRALMSVSDKTGIVEFARGLKELGFQIISTGGTSKVLTEAGIDVTNISDVTGYPECLDGRVKTLHPKIHGGILAMRDNEEHMKQICNLDIQPIDIVAINLYPFRQTIQKDGVTLEEAIENIDIGGPTMIRAAAKNYQDVTVIVDPADYSKVLDELKVTDQVSKDMKFNLAYKVFEHTSHYDTLIATYLRTKLSDGFLPDTLTLTFEKAQDMRYGENPHQKAVFYKEVGKNVGCLPGAKQLHGKELSYNNIYDANGAIELLKEFDEPCVVAVKHANPCGVACKENIYEAYLKVYEADPISIFGGIVAANREIDEQTAEEINKIFVEIVIAPSFSDSALSILTKKKNIRLLQLDSINNKVSEDTYDMKKVLGGILVQSYNNKLLDDAEIKCVTKNKPSETQMKDLIFAMKVVKHTKSNAIVLVKDKQTVGIGPGQTGRILAANIAIDYAGDKAKGSVMASDAFFPFPDCVEVAFKCGIVSIIQPGGSLKDDESIQACDKYGISMIFSGIRHFKH